MSGRLHSLTYDTINAVMPYLDKNTSAFSHMTWLNYPFFKLFKVR